MKNFLAYPLSMLIVATCGITSCQKNQDLPVTTASSQATISNSKGAGVVTATAIDTSNSPAPIESIITVGTWKVTSYVEGIENSTVQFANFTFTFLSNGTMIANEKGKITTGRWTYVTSAFYYGIPIYGSSPDGFNIVIGAKRPLVLLGKNLFISKKNSTSFFIDSVNPAENAHVTFTII